MTTPSINSVKELILRCYRKIDPRSLDGLTKTKDGYLTADHKWIYVLRFGGFIEREPAVMVPLHGQDPIFLVDQWLKTRGPTP